MSLRDHFELENTREKLRLLESMYAQSAEDSPDNLPARELSRRSIKRLINRLKEEIVRFEIQSGAPRKGDAADSDPSGQAPGLGKPPAVITSQQRRVLEQAGGSAIRLEDPQSKKTYVLLSAENYDRIRSLIDSDLTAIW